MLRNPFRRRRPEQLDVNIVDRCSAQEDAEREAARRRLLAQAAHSHDVAEPDAPRWNGPTTIGPRDAALGQQHRAGGAR